jgi:CheY-like chemotaxis protein
MPETSIPVDLCLSAKEIAAQLPGLVEGAPIPVRQRARVMVVEDDWLLATDLEKQLRELGHDVIASVGSAEKALDSAADVLPDVVIMDIRLGGVMLGTEGAALLRARFGLPIIFLTAYADARNLSAAQASEPQAFLAKPHQTSELSFAITLALNGRNSLTKR